MATSQQKASGGQIFIAVVIMAILLAGVGWIIFSAVTGGAPNFRNPDFIEGVLGSRVVLAFVRVAVLAAAVYIVVSVIALISRGQWLSSVGPFKVQDSIRAIASENKELQERLSAAETEIEELRGQVASSEARRRTATEARDQAMDGWQRTLVAWERERQGDG